MTGRLLTTRKVADFLGLSTESVLRRWRRGDIPGGIRLTSNVLRFRESANEEWLAGLEMVASVGSAPHTAGRRD
jgi:predicted DNA-binding transcriptional regulator AlpA